VMKSSGQVGRIFSVLYVADGALNKTKTLEPVLWIRIGFNEDTDPNPNPAFYLNADSDLDPISYKMRIRIRILVRIQSNKKLNFYKKYIIVSKTYQRRYKSILVRQETSFIC
jgi:hypothetical protein